MKKILTLIAACLCLAGISNAQTSSSCQKSALSISILGDSYSTFQDYMVPDSNNVWYPLHDGNQNDVTKVEETWWHILLKDMGYKLCQNNSYSGSTIGYHGYNDMDFSLRSFENRANDLGNPDIILIFGATNDSWSGTKVGEYKYGDWKKEELYTYRPALAKMLNFMTLRYLNVKIYFILNTELRDDITESTLEICKHYNVPVIALHDIDKQSGHPSIVGMRQIADQIADYLRKH